MSPGGGPGNQHGRFNPQRIRGAGNPHQTNPVHGKGLGILRKIHHNPEKTQGDKPEGSNNSGGNSDSDKILGLPKPAVYTIAAVVGAIFIGLIVYVFVLKNRAPATQVLDP